ncbi:ShlB/FhaC/HecB family hemolysin secretion/activation protein [Erwinia psidii]|uniref:ShlB/FhaC/HecB family hemolysin secretion/activation protein n=1 Tax=Erwinia psidii TaxID=69224 RepID=UPI00397D5739
MHQLHLLRIKSFLCFICLIKSACVTAQDNSFNEQLINQQQRQQVLESRLKPPTQDVRFSDPGVDTGLSHFPQEKNCFVVHRVVLEGDDRIPGWLPLQRIASDAMGKCLGGEGINLLMKRLQNRLISHGYITTRVMAPEQNMKSGTVKLRVIPGNVRNVKLTGDDDIFLHTVFPAHSGTLFDLRDSEQGLENLQRLPGTQASIKIIPGETPGESDIEISRKKNKNWRTGITLDDSATRSIGRYQAGVSLSLDNPFSLSDLFYISGSHDLYKGSGKGNRNLTTHYSLPLGYWAFGITAWNYKYHQTVSGYSRDYLYSGRIKNINAQLSRVMHRGRNQKTTLTYDLQARESRNYLYDTEIEIQRRRTSSWRFGLQHRHYFGKATFDANISYQRGTRWFGALPAPEEYSGSATALSKFVRTDMQLNIPFNFRTQQFRYNVRYLHQASTTPLTVQEQLSLGNRWTVRGFDGERTLNASQGWFLRNDFAWRTPLPGQELYLGLDYGKVSGNGSQYLTGTHLAGSQLGVRGNAFNVNYDLFAATPLSKPDAFETSKLTLGFSMSWSY